MIRHLYGRTLMRKPLYLLLAVTVLAVGSWIATRASAQRGQEQSKTSFTPASQDQDIERVIIRRVQLPITVTDKKGQFVSGLTAEDFLIFEDRKQQQIETFTDESRESLPLFIGVLIDTSPSAIAKLKFQQETALSFIHTVARLRKDKVALVTFDHEVKVRQDFTSKLDLIDRAISELKKPGTNTALYDAIWQFCNEKMRSAPGRRALVVMTDGEDTYSRATLRDTIDMAQRTDTIIFAVSTRAGFSGTVPGVEVGIGPDRADRDLIKLCEETGGRAFFIGDQQSLERSFADITKEVRSQYVVTYRPTNERYDGSFRRIEVQLAKNRSGLKVRAKRGYRAVAENATAPPLGSVR